MILSEITHFLKNTCMRWSMMIGILCGVCVNVTAQTLEMHNFFQVRSPVFATAPRVKNEALQQAMTQLIIKMTGNSSISPAIKARLAKLNIQQFVTKLAYQSETLPELGTAHALNVQFNPDAISQWLKQNKLSLWSSDRPLVLVWMVQHAFSPNTDQTIVSNDSYNVLKLYFDYFAEQRGLPVEFPVFSPEDTQKVTAADVWKDHYLRLQSFSDIYNSDAMIVVKLVQISRNRWQSFWTLLANDSLKQWKFSATNKIVLMNLGVNAITDALAKQRDNAAVKGLMHS